MANLVFLWHGLPARAIGFLLIGIFIFTMPEDNPEEAFHVFAINSA